MLIKISLKLLIASLIFLNVTSCGYDPTQKPSERQFVDKKILYINSYHKGYKWSDQIEFALRETIANTKAELKTIYLDTKRKRSEDDKRRAGLEAKKIIDKFQPDIVIVSDDNAAKYVIVPFYKDADLPFVFCGVNWDVSAYGFPFTNVTGMLEVEAIQTLVNELERYADGKRLGYLGLDSLTEYKTVEHLQLYLRHGFEKVYFVNYFDEWMDAFTQAQTDVDILLLGVQESVTGWNDAIAKAFVADHIQIPVGTFYDWLVDYAIIGVIKDPKEHGYWAAKTALNILDGIEVNNIPIVSSSQNYILINEELAKILKIELSPEIRTLAKETK